MPEHRCKYRYNTFLNWKMREFKKFGVLLKVLHADPESYRMFGSTLDTDLRPFITYSLNKQKRWEVSQKVDQELLENLQNLNENLQVMVFQRTCVKLWTDKWLWCAPQVLPGFQSSKIRKSAEISEDGRYQEAEFGGVGRFYGPSTSKDQIPTEVVSYNIIQEPKNWKKVFAKDFKKSPFDRYDFTQQKARKCEKSRIQYDLDEYYDDFYEEDMENGGIEEDFIQEEKPKEFYKFDDYTVSKSRRKSHKIRSLDGFIIV